MSVEKDALKNRIVEFVSDNRFAVGNLSKKTAKVFFSRKLCDTAGFCIYYVNPADWEPTNVVEGSKYDRFVDAWFDSHECTAFMLCIINDSEVDYVRPTHVPQSSLFMFNVKDLTLSHVAVKKQRFKWVYRIARRLINALGKPRD